MYIYFFFQLDTPPLFFPSLSTRFWGGKKNQLSHYKEREPLLIRKSHGQFEEVIANLRERERERNCLRWLGMNWVINLNNQ